MKNNNIYNGQLLVVDTKLRIMDIYDNGYFIKSFDDVWIGKNGYCLESDMFEGGMKTPLGEYFLGVAFGNTNLNLNYPYIMVNEGSYWVDDVKSKYYNYFVQIGESDIDVDYPYIVKSLVKKFDSAEHLIDYKKAYKYAVFIEYNAASLEKKPISGRGSAIFLHCHGTKGYTGGCVAIKEDDMKWILNFLDYDKKPKIIIK